MTKVENNELETLENPTFIELAKLVNSVIEERPQEFIDNYNELMQARISELVAQRKVDIQQGVFGVAQEEPEIEPEDEELPPEEVKPEVVA